MWVSNQNTMGLDKDLETIKIQPGRILLGLQLKKQKVIVHSFWRRKEGVYQPRSI